MRSDTVVPAEDPRSSPSQQVQEREQRQRDFALLRARALALGRALSSSSSPSPFLATDVEILAVQVSELPLIGESEVLVAEEGWLVAAVADLRARVRSLSRGEAATATAAAATAAAKDSSSSAVLQRFERTTLKFFMPGTSSANAASRRLRLELGRRMALAGPSGRGRLGFPAERRDESFDGHYSSSASSSSSSSAPSEFLFEGRVTSVYFDEPESLPALTSRGLRLDGASLVRARYYGSKEGSVRQQQQGAAKASALASTSSSAARMRKESDGGVGVGGVGGGDRDSLASTAVSPPTVWLERKVHRDPSSGERSFKERVALTGAEAAALVEALPPRKKKDASSSSSSRSRSCSSSSSSPLSSLAAAALRVALGPGAVPLLRTEAERTAFEGDEGSVEERGLRVTVDERVRMSAVGAEGRKEWLFDDDDEGGKDGNERARRLLFPFTIVEVKLAGSSDQPSSIPTWLETLLADPSLAIARAPRFSKALHAMAALSAAGLLRSPLPAAAATALPEVSRALLLAESKAKETSSVAFRGGHRSTASLPAAGVDFCVGAAVSYAAATAANCSFCGDFDLESDGGGGAAAAATATSTSTSPRPPPNSVFFAVAAASSVSSPRRSGNGVSSDSFIAVPAEDSVVAPPKGLPPIRTSKRKKFASRARARVVAAAAAIVALKQQQQRKRSSRKQRGSEEGALLPTAFVRRAPFKVEPKGYWANERTLIAYLQAALLVMLLATSLLGSSGNGGGAGGGGAALPSKSSSSSSSSSTCSTVACKAAAMTGALIAPSAVLFILYALFVFRRRAKKMTAVARGVAGTTAAVAAEVERSDDTSGAAAFLVAIAVVAGGATVTAAVGGLFREI